MKRLGRFGLGDLEVEVCEGRDSVWAIVRREGKGGLALRTAYVPGGNYECRKLVPEPGVDFQLEVQSAQGRHVVCFVSSGDGNPPAARGSPLHARDQDAHPVHPARPLSARPQRRPDLGARGNVEAAQRGMSAGLVYFRVDEPAFGSVLYFQNLTALNPYFLATGTKPEGAVGGEWPELGYLPPTPDTQELDDPAPLPKGKEVILSDAIIVVRDWAGDNEQEMARQFLQMLGVAYLVLDLPRPSTATGSGAPSARCATSKRSRQATSGTSSATATSMPYTGR